MEFLCTASEEGNVIDGLHKALTGSQLVPWVRNVSFMFPSSVLQHRIQRASAHVRMCVCVLHTRMGGIPQEMPDRPSGWI